MTTQKTICIVSPGHLSTNPRMVKEARATKTAGYSVRVVHGSFSRWGTETDRLIASELEATEAVPFGPTNASRGTYIRQTLVRHATRTLASAGLFLPLLAEMANSPVAIDLAAATGAIKADLYIAHYVAALPAAAHAAKRHGGQYAFDAEDFHLGDLPDTPKNKIDKQLISAIEKRYLPGAAYVSAASSMIASAYSDTYGITMPTTILNVFSKNNAPPTPTSCGAHHKSPSLYWFSQTIGPGRGLETAVEAIARSTSRPHLFLRGTPAGNYARELFSLAMRAGVREHIHLLDPAPPDDLERLGSAYDLGFVGEMPGTRNRQIALTNKMFSYVIGGVPSIASDVPAHRHIAPEFGAAMSLFRSGDATALASVIDSYLLDPDRLAAARLHAWNLGQKRFNWEQESHAFLALVEHALTRPSIPGGGVPA